MLFSRCGPSQRQLPPRRREYSFASGLLAALKVEEQLELANAVESFTMTISIPQAAYCWALC